MIGEQQVDRSGFRRCLSDTIRRAGTILRRSSGRIGYRTFGLLTAAVTRRCLSRGRRLQRHDAHVGRRISGPEIPLRVVFLVVLRRFELGILVGAGAREAFRVMRDLRRFRRRLTVGLHRLVRVGRTRRPQDLGRRRLDGHGPRRWRRFRRRRLRRGGSPWNVGSARRRRTCNFTDPGRRRLRLTFGRIRRQRKGPIGDERHVGGLRDRRRQYPVRRR